MRTFLALTLSIGIAALLIASCSPTESSDKEITSFSFLGISDTGVIDEDAKIITVQIPRNADIEKLVASFTTTGKKVEVGSAVQKSGETENDFSSPVVYTVTAEDNSTANYSVTVSYYKRCLFYSTLSDSGNQYDRVVIDKVRSWKYDVTVRAINPVSWNADSLIGYDFIMMAETPNSSDYYPLKGHPLPILNLEAWAADKNQVLNWGKGSTVANYSWETCVITGETGHPLLAGFSKDEKFQLVDSSIVAGEAVIAFEPAIDVIPIANLKDSLDLVCACAVEAGTLLQDGLTTTENRAVTIGIHAHSNEYITDEAYKLIQAGIHWILGETQTFETEK